MLAVVIALVIIFCGFMLIFTVYFRFLKLMVIVPLGAIAFSTVSGNRMVSHTAVTYAKYFLSIVLEAVTMALAIIVCNAFLNAGLPAFTSSYADFVTQDVMNPVPNVMGTASKTAHSVSDSVFMKHLLQV